MLGQTSLAYVSLWVTGDGGVNRFRPAHPTNRVEAAMVVARLRVRLVNEVERLAIDKATL